MSRPIYTRTGMKIIGSRLNPNFGFKLLLRMEEVRRYNSECVPWFKAAVQPVLVVLSKLMEL